MHRRILASTVLSLFIFLFLLSGPAVSQGEKLSEEEAIGKSREIAKNLSNELQDALAAAFGQGDFLKGIEACSTTAQKITRDFQDTTGYYIRRVSLRYRNQSNSPDPYEKEVLNEFERLGKAGNITEDHEDYKVTFEEGARYIRYLKPIITKELCLSCHGGEDDIPDSVKRFIQTVYPQDMATGYKAGDVRGAISIRIPVTYPAP
ncbi:MAG TPA: DUF3365 domain-containing protein [Thermodesulfobacteriota bacterium]|nr:DUF3365 domain-containing protein [Thermodesulfobacteriota bacterium]